MNCSAIRLEQGRWGSPMETGVDGQSLTAEDRLFILIQAALYLTALRGHASLEARSCYERAESVCHSLNHPRLLYVALIGHWRYSLGPHLPDPATNDFCELDERSFS